MSRLGKLTVAALVGICLLLVVGWFWAAVFIDDGVTRFSGEERLAAEDAVTSTIMTCHSRVGWSLMVPNVRVTSVELLPGYVQSYRRVRRYRAEVRETTLFSISLGSSVVHAEDEKHAGETVCAF